MPKLSWDNAGEKLYETGVDHAVLYPQDSSGAYTTGVAWNGITGITQSPSGGESNPIYADNIKYADLRSAEDFGATVEAYTYPDEFAACDGSAEIAPGVMAGQQARKAFGLTYRTKIGNDTDGDSHGYKLHIIYGATVSPSEKGYSTVNDSPDAINFSWELTTTPIEVTGFKPTAHIEIDSTKVDASKLAELETMLYGGEGESATAKLPTPAELVTLFGTTGG